MSMLVVPGMVVDAANTHGVYPFLTEIFPASDLVDKLVANFAFQHGYNLLCAFLLSIEVRP